MMVIRIILILMVFMSTDGVFLAACEVKLRSARKTGKGIALLLNISLAPGEFLIKKNLQISVDSPRFYVDSRKIHPKATKVYIGSIKNHKKVYTQSMTLAVQLLFFNEYEALTDSANLCLSYYLVEGHGNIRPHITMIPIPEVLECLPS